ncbi:16S rRNA (cytosine(967)-C(5))-methyltransferase RsmB [Eubacterium sp.]|uniref:16S rRNA (cytosine(967)-C(5))-methyltransferase RsmB n=1 Tax=Eubacterium sp. TaxID=142586 RepID=UPI0025EF3E30|nr:16S rRNA (cytosine(967)-C(5))-methyltransferase RsmB [Eubacterium sp.]MCR5629502.1 16S rRNA (cytosine(967)-C(5))-methyltransferase RsmB [Eubacterium sp.]
MTARVNVRNIAVNALVSILENEEKSHIVERNYMDKNELSDVDRSFFLRLVEGTIERKITLDYIISLYSKTSINKMKKVIRNVLRMSIYQILYMEQVPDRSAVDEAVKICKKRSFAPLSGFVNGVLRSIVREKEDILKKIEEADDSIKYSIPEEVLELYGDKKDKVLSSLFNERHINARLNLSKHSKAEIIAMLVASGVKVYDNPYVESAVYIEKFGDITKNPVYAMGLITIMDTASMIPGLVSGVKDGDIVVDVCSAPGGKAIHIAEMLNGTGTVYARDLTEGKVSLINENIKRTGVKNVQSKIFDARNTDKSLIGKADVLICDVPCSGLGVINNKSDIKYRIKKEDVLELSKLQKEIVDSSIPYVKKGGTLVYSTCTLTEEENMGMVKYILDNFDFKLSSLNPYLSENMKNETTDEGYLEIIPGEFDMDGFFIARFIRG